VRTGIQSNVGKAFLANSITLTPGTLSVDSEGDEIYVHVVDGSSLQNEADIIQLSRLFGRSI
jgi:multicomponent Na+:H+ antiporter subunit E